MAAIVATFEEENYEECIDSSLNRITAQYRHARNLGADEASREKQLIRDFNKAVLKAKETLGDDGLRIHNLSPLLQNLNDCRSKLIPLLTTASSTPQESLEIALTRINVPLVFALFDLDLIDCFLALEFTKTSGTHGTDTLLKDSHTGYQAISFKKENLDDQLQLQLDQLDLVVTKVVNPLREAKEKVHQVADGSREEMKRVIEQLLHIIQKYIHLREDNVLYTQVLLAEPEVVSVELLVSSGTEVESVELPLPESMSGVSMSDIYPDIDFGRLTDQYAEMSMTEQAAEYRERRVITKEQCEEINR